MNSFKSVLLAAALVLATWATPASSTAQSPQVPPDDSQDFYLVTLTADQPSPACRQLTESLRHPAVARIAAACKVFHFKPNDELYRQRYAQSLPPHELPAVALARHDGGVIFKAHGGNIPAPEVLAQSLTQMAALANASDPGSSVAGNTLRPIRPLQPWDGSNLRPNLIPDTVVISPQVNVPAGITNGLLIGGVLIFLLFAGVIVIGVIGAAFFFTQ